MGLLRSPETADPVEDMDEAQARQASVLADMVENDAITQAAADEALAAPIEASDRTEPASPTDGVAPHFVEWVRQQTVEAVGEDALYGQGLRIVTTLDRDAQAAAEAAVAEATTDPAGPQAALVALDEDGAIRAHVGSRSYDELAVDLVRGADGGGSGRQPGSTFKPFVLQAALDQGVTLADRYRGPPRIEVDVDGTPFPVENYGGSAFGELTVADATKRSVNTVYAQLLAEVGPTAVADAAARGRHRRRAGPGALARPRCRGGEPARPGQRLPHLGQRRHRASSRTPSCGSRTPTATCSGSPTAPHPRKGPSSRDIARGVTEALRGVIEDGTGTAADIGRPAAGKTGTTQDNVDAWFAGYVPGYTAVVWMGHPQPTPMEGVTGGGAPAQIWQRFMAAAMEGRDASRLPRSTRRAAPAGSR